MNKDFLGSESKTDYGLPDVRVRIYHDDGQPRAQIKAWHRNPDALKIESLVDTNEKLDFIEVAGKIGAIALSGILVRSQKDKLTKNL